MLRANKDPCETQAEYAVYVMRVKLIQGSYWKTFSGKKKSCHEMTEPAPEILLVIVTSI